FLYLVMVTAFVCLPLMYWDKYDSYTELEKSKKFNGVAIGVGMSFAGMVYFTYVFASNCSMAAHALKVVLNAEEK
ncbi:MAG: hypothetical protein L6Q71_01895, partial [Planctomycetes bacterium]|nr:hypothetical protein [Planctomycetota bacterium]